MLRGETPFNARTRAEFDGFMAQLFAKPPFLPPRLRDVLLARNQAGHAFNARVLDEIGRGERAFELEAKLDRIHSPTLVLWCKDDRILDVSSVGTLARIRPPPTVTVIQECCHMCDDGTATRVRRFLCRPGSRAATPAQPQVAVR